MSLPTHILVATDFSDASRPAIEAAAAQAKAAGAKLSLVHVFDPTPMIPPAAIPAPRKMEESVSRELQEQVEHELVQIRKSALAEVDDVQTLALRHANAAFAICDYAEKNDVNLIVVGTHGRTGLAHLLIGSVAERVVRHAKSPVLTVPSPAAR
ncbi:MAG: universal stress protein [Myxococcota bacterium]